MGFFAYPVWDGKKVIGHYSASHALKGESIAFPYRDSKGFGSVKVPLIWFITLVPYTEVSRDREMMLDVRWKSKRQLKIIKKFLS